ncbi:MAG: hypothetical protein HYY08_04585 [Firmicutes bacterium]|nr:hypothetical protein [Bacillota bacterium]
MTERVDRLKRLHEDFGIEAIDLEENCDLPSLMGWAGVDFQLGRARHVEELSRELGARPPGRKRGREV